MLHLRTKECYVNCRLLSWKKLKLSWDNVFIRKNPTPYPDVTHSSVFSDTIIVHLYGVIYTFLKPICLFRLPCTWTLSSQILLCANSHCWFYYTICLLCSSTQESERRRRDTERKMDRNYNRCRQYIPAGWGTARTLAPCNRLDRAVTFRATEYKPDYSPMVLSAQQGMNLARDKSIPENPDPCHGRRFCPPSKQPINIELKMCPVPNTSNEGQACGIEMSACTRPRYSRKMSQLPDAKVDPYCQQCPNVCPLPRCPPGIKVERTMPIIPKRRLQESAFKMPNASVYKLDFVPRKPEITKSFAPERIVVELQGEFQQESLTKYDYKPLPVCPYKKPPWAFMKAREESSLKMSGTSRYKLDYVPKIGAPAPSAKPVRMPDAEPPLMDDKTVYRVDYTPHCLPERFVKAKEEDASIAACCPFDGLSVYKRDYIPKKGKPALSVLDKERTFAKILAPMDDATTYKASFGPFYFGDQECIPADVYDALYPPRDKCCDIRSSCEPEPERELENPVQAPQPPCPPPVDGSYCPSPYEMRCSPQAVPCVSPYKLKRENNPYGDSLTIRVEHNAAGECQNEPVEYVCPQQPCRSF